MANQSSNLRIGLLDNSSHSLKRGYEMWSLWRKTEDAWLLKESIIWIHHGIELSLKQLLAQTNAFLVFENVDSAIENLGKLRKKAGMENAGVIDLFDNSEKIKSVGFQSLIDRVVIALSIPELTKNAPLREKIDELTKFRNKVVHFSIELDIAAVSSLLSEILDPLLVMLGREVKDDNFVRNQIPEIRKIAQPVKKYGEELRQDIVANAIEATENALPPKGNRRAGIVWQTIGTGLGKTLVDYLLRVKQLPQIRNNHIIVLADRVELATQIYRIISNALSQENRFEVIIPGNRIELREILESDKPKIIVSTVQKLTDDQFETDREILIIGYNLHGLSERLPWNFPNATYILFTSTPPISDSASRSFFGDLVGKYDLMRSVTDGIVIPLQIEKRVIELNLNTSLLETFEFDVDAPSSLKSNSFITLPGRIEAISKDIVAHFSTRQDKFLGKGIVVVPDIRSGVAYSQSIAKFKGNADFVEAISSETKAEKRELLVKKFLRQEDHLCILVVTAGFLLGMDNPLIHTIYVTSPVSLQLGYQLAGLVSRPFQGKEDALIVDYVGLNWYLNDLFESGNTNA
ncbi:MAG: DEAD/DEAH box helicase family protein [Anaerolineales bacterium]|nr:DEAD/DEAH box helicase family protein [Anaerolineales bacterium]